jgi:OmpA-OmpF porin, OOP family
MSKRGNLGLGLALVITAGLGVGGVWLLNRVSPGLLGGLINQNNQGQGSSSITSTDGVTRLTVMGDTFSGYSTFRSTAFTDVLKKSGIDLAYKNEFDQAKRAAALNEGQVDLMVTTLDQFLKQQPKGKIVGLIDRTIGADAVVLNTRQYPQLKSLLDLNQLVKQSQAKGQRLAIAFAGDTPSEYLALVLDTKFEAFNLSDFEVKKVADASEAWKLMQDPKQSVAIAVLWEPFVTQARQQGDTIVLSSRDAPKAIVDVIVASDRLIQSQPKVISTLLEDYYRRIDANVRDASQLQQQIASDGNLSEADAGAVLRGIDFFTAPESQTWMTDGTLKQRIGSTAAVLVLAGRLNQVPGSPNDLFTPQFLSKATANTQTLISLVRADSPDLADKLAGKSTLVVSTRPVPTASQIKAAPSIGNLQVRGEVKFGTGSATLTPTGEQTLNQLAQEIAEFNPETVAVRVIGHTSRTGSASVNQALSQQRAQVVVEYLRNRKLKQTISAEGKGFSAPVPGIPPADARNQRTEIRLVRVS